MNGRCCVDCSQRFYRILTQRVQKYFIFSNFNLKEWIVWILFGECGVSVGASVNCRTGAGALCLRLRLKCCRTGTVAGF